MLLAQYSMIGDVYLGAEQLELDGAHEGEDEADQDADEGNDGKGLRPALLDHFLHDDQVV